MARLDIVYTQGGIYLDTDVEIIRNMDPLLEDEAFMGFEDGKFVALGLGFGAAKGNQHIKAMRDVYEGVSFINPDGSFNTLPSPHYTTEYLLEKGLKQNDTFQQIEGISIYPKAYFCPRDYYTGAMNLTEKFLYDPSLQCFLAFRQGKAELRTQAAPDRTLRQDCRNRPALRPVGSGYPEKERYRRFDRESSEENRRHFPEITHRAADTNKNTILTAIHVAARVVFCVFGQLFRNQAIIKQFLCRARLCIRLAQFRLHNKQIRRQHRCSRHRKGHERYGCIARSFQEPLCCASTAVPSCSTVTVVGDRSESLYQLVYSP